MGTFEKIRSISPYFFAVFAILLIAYFVFTSGGEDIARQQMGDPKTAPIATINGEDIRYAEFEKKVQEQAEQQKAQMQDVEQEVDYAQIRKQVWNQMIEAVLVKQEADKAGIIVTDDEINDILIENPPEFLTRGFTDSAGNFNRAAYLELITNPDNLRNYLGPNAAQMPEEEIQKSISDFRNQLIFISEYMKSQKLTERLMNLVSTSGAMISPEYAKEKYIAENSLASVEFVALDVASIKDEEIEITDEEIKEYYDNHKKQYKQKPQRKIKYLNFRITPSGTDSNKAQKRIERIAGELNKGTNTAERDSIFDLLLDQFTGETVDYTLVKDIPQNKMNFILSLGEREVMGPVQLAEGTFFFRLDGKREGEQEVVKAKHILVKFGENKDSARAETIRIMKMAKSGSLFSKLATDFSQDPGSARSGGDLGYFPKGRMVKPFEEAAFGAKVGDIVGPVESDFGFHIIKVEDKKSEEIKFSQLTVVPKISSITRNLIRQEAYSIKKQVEEGTSFDTIARRLRRNAIETQYFEKDKPILGSQYVTDKSFEVDLGIVLDPIELNSYGYVVIQVSDIRNAGVQPLEEVKEQISNRLLNIKKLDMLKPKAEKLYSAVSSSNDLNSAVGVEPNLEVKMLNDLKNTGSVPGYGQLFAFSTEVFRVPLGKISQPIRDQRGYFLIKVLTRTIPDNSQVEQNIAEYTKELKTNAKQSAYYQWFRKVREDSEIEDFRSNYYREY